MIRRPLPYSISLTSLFYAWPTVAANAEAAADVVTGLGNTGIGMFIIAIAVTLLLTLVFRASATHVTRVVTKKIGKRRILRILRSKTADVMDDFILPGAYGGLTHIDFAILTSGGILCIQAKHYNGVVFGGSNEPQWTNIDGIHRRKFLNPMIQNEGRTRALQNAAPNVPVANLVIFSGSVQFTSPLEKNVIHVRDLDSYIAKFVFGPCKIEDWDAVWMTVKSATLTDEDSRNDFQAQLGFS